MSDDFDDFDDDDDYGGSGSAIPAFVLPFVTAGAALLVGALLGGLIVWLVKPAELTEVQVPRDLTQSELEEVCAPFVIEKEDEVQEIQNKVVTLAKDIQSKQARVDELESEMKRRNQRGAAMVAELEAAKKELAEVKQELVEVKEERDQLVVDLKATIVQLEKTEEELVVQKEETRVAKEDALSNKWFRFVNKAQLDICEKGGRKKMGKCREKITAVMNDEVMGKFAHCVRAGQAVPSVRELEKKQTPPEYSNYLDQDDRITKDWILMLCDPTLPEADMPHEKHLPPG